jgi:hypothetical protein
MLILKKTKLVFNLYKTALLLGNKKELSLTLMTLLMLLIYIIEVFKDGCQFRDCP